jgi:hypothetical protein
MPGDLHQCSARAHLTSGRQAYRDFSQRVFSQAHLATPIPRAARISSDGNQTASDYSAEQRTAHKYGGKESRLMA